MQNFCNPQAWDFCLTTPLLFLSDNKLEFLEQEYCCELKIDLNSILDEEGVSFDGCCKICLQVCGVHASVQLIII